ncbi:RICIN domain-containing protein [Streptomyces sp. NBC_00249]|uniref:RICIN domain-containing protein n=1 Tax=Streptomyces sp. NBC_00249 TaxID=2975690 RepID=UPI00224DB094|nr:RICIN domain-containing protein [Streptomyces sp. NBC_00249]MCX5195151.1 RICIN domain-containing protein [Streptomyces sp. NBC_00249]
MRFTAAKNVRRTLGAAIGALLISLVLPASPAAAANLSRWDLLLNLNSSKCLEVGGWSTANGAGVNQWDCHPGANQEWFGAPYGGGYLIYNRHSGKCLEVQGWSKANGATIGQWDCHGGANQQWRVPNPGEFVLTLVNVNSGKCLEIGGWRTDNGAPATQWDCHGGDNQAWY